MTSLREPWRQLIRSSPSCPSLRASGFFSVIAPTASLCVGPLWRRPWISTLSRGEKKITRVFIKVFGQFGFWFSLYVCRLPHRINALPLWRSRVSAFHPLNYRVGGTLQPFSSALPSHVAPSKSTFRGKFKDLFCFDFFFYLEGGGGVGIRDDLLFRQTIKTAGLFFQSIEIYPAWQPKTWK